jgi:hypothetical protein
MNSIQSRTAKCNKGRFPLNHKEKVLRKRNRIDLETTTSLRPRFGFFKTRHFLDLGPLHHPDVWHLRVPLGTPHYILLELHVAQPL